MISTFYNIWQNVKSSLWFVPSCICLVYFGLAFGIYYAEIHYFLEIDLPYIFFSGGNDDAKAVTIALLSSMITMSTLAISITMVTLSLAASQLGPRIIKNFMSDRQTQYFIGMFFGSVVACFLLTMILHDADPKAITPQVSITTVFAMCFANLFVLLGFVHHVAKAGVADNVIIKISEELHQSIRKFTVLPKDCPKVDTSTWPEDFEQNKGHLFLSKSNYIQHIDYEKMADVAAKNHLKIQLLFRAGHYVLRNQYCLAFYPAKALAPEAEQALRDCIITGNFRTSTQELGYSIRHLVEIAMRALSPGINDPHTAITVIDHLSSALALLFERRLCGQWYTAEDGRPVIKPNSMDGLEVIYNAFDEIRHHGKNSPHVLNHLLNKINVLSVLAREEKEKQGLEEQFKKISFDIEQLSNTALLETNVKSQQILNLQQRVESKLT